MKVLRIENYRGCDTYYMPLEDKDGTWEEVLSYIEAVLDDQFCKTKTIVGCKIEAEVVEMTSAEIEELDYE